MKEISEDSYNGSERLSKELDESSRDRTSSRDHSPPPRKNSSSKQRKREGTASSSASTCSEDSETINDYLLSLGKDPHLFSLNFRLYEKNSNAYHRDLLFPTKLIDAII